MDESDPASEAVESALEPVTIANRADNVDAHNIVQVGVVHGGVHIAGGPRIRDGSPLNVSVETVQDDSTTYEYEGGVVHPDEEVRIFVEAFSAQAVLLHRLRPVLVREITDAEVVYHIRMDPREFELVLDRPVPARVHEYDADIVGRSLRLNGVPAESGADFPLYVTASDPEYFVIRPTSKDERRPVEWQLKLYWSCLGQRGTVTIGHDRRPFLSEA